MTPPNDAVTLVKEALRITTAALLATDLQNGDKPYTFEQLGLLFTLEYLHVARFGLQCLEGENYVELLVFLLKATPRLSRQSGGVWWEDF